MTLKSFSLHYQKLNKIPNINLLALVYLNISHWDILMQKQKLFNILRTPMVGASGAIFGIVAAFSTLFPDAKLMFLFIPYPIKAKYLTPIIIAVSIFLGLRQFSGDNIAHFAHIGGALIGYLFVYNFKKNRDRIQ